VHAVRAAVSLPLPVILTTYRESDNCIPLTALFRLLLDAGVRLGEGSFPRSVDPCGLLLLVLLPLLPLDIFLRERRRPGGTILPAISSPGS